MDCFFKVEYELENRVLGDIDYHADNPDNFQNFFDFTIDEIKTRYTDFLNLSTDTEDMGDNGQDPNQNSGNADDQVFEQAESREQPADNNYGTESNVDQVTIEESFNDFNYWKPQVDYNLDQLLNEMNKN